MRKYLLLLLLTSNGLFAYTDGIHEFTCPIDSHKFQDTVVYSSTFMGQYLDFDKLGNGPYPWYVPRCDQCGYVLYKDELGADTLDVHKRFVLGSEYSSVWQKHSDYYCLALMKEDAGFAAEEVLYAYVLAVWEISDKNSKHFDQYAASVIKYAGIVSKMDTLAWDGQGLRQHVFAAYIGIEMYRRRGQFDKAKAWLRQFGKIELKDVERFLESIIAYQKRLIAAKDSASHQMSES